MANHGWPQLVSASLYRSQEQSHGQTTALLETAAAQYDRSAGAAERDVKLGSAGAIAILLAAFAFFFARWARVAASRERVLRVVDEKSDELRHQALHDALTGLPNRVLIIDRAQQMLARAQRDGLTIAALFIDLDGFKSINDTFGHPAGDALLRAVGERIQLVIRESDTVGRLGGDEFVVLTEASEFDAGPELIAERLLEVLRQPFDLGSLADVRVQVSASIGIAIGDRPSADELLRDADVALYEAKTAGKDRYVVFRQEMQVAVQDRLSLEMDLRDALADDELFLVYQPTFDLADGAATRLRGAASLAASGARSPHAVRDHPGRRAEQADRRDRPLGSVHRLRTGRGLASRGLSGRDRSQRFGPATGGPEVRRDRGRRARGERSRPALSRPRDHRDRAHAQSRQGRRAS